MSFTLLVNDKCITHYMVLVRLYDPLRMSSLKLHFSMPRNNLNLQNKPIHSSSSSLKLFVIPSHGLFCTINEAKEITKEKSHKVVITSFQLLHPVCWAHTINNNNFSG